MKKLFEERRFVFKLTVDTADEAVTIPGDPRTLELDVGCWARAYWAQRQLVMVVETSLRVVEVQDWIEDQDWWPRERRQVIDLIDLTARDDKHAARYKPGALRYAFDRVDDYVDNVRLELDKLPFVELDGARWRCRARVGHGGPHVADK